MTNFLTNPLTKAQ
ncbi:unnamed protein product, partial [Allacma fusca]